MVHLLYFAVPTNIEYIISHIPCFFNDFTVSLQFSFSSKLFYFFLIVLNFLIVSFSWISIFNYNISRNFANFLRKFVSFILIYFNLYAILFHIGNDNKQMWFCRNRFEKLTSKPPSYRCELFLFM